MVKTKKKLIIGLTGGIGSGKSAAAQSFERLGITVVDADASARQVTQRTQVLQKISDHFGPKVILPGGQLDRAALRALIFNEPAEKNWLEQLLHPLIRADMFKALESAPSPYALLSAPLLLENKLARFVDRVLVIDVPETLQVARASTRDACNTEIIQKIMAAQWPRHKRNAQADDIIDNSGDLDSLAAQVKAVHEKYLALARHLGPPGQ